MIHVIDESSPLFGKTADDFEVLDMGLVLNMQGMDESTAQLMQARQVYGYENIKWQHNYVDAIYTDADGAAHIDYAAFHETEAI